MEFQQYGSLNKTAQSQHQLTRQCRLGKIHTVPPLDEELQTTESFERGRISVLRNELFGKLFNLK